MRHLAALLLLAAPAWAEDIVLRADVTAATLHPDAALVTRAAEAALPAGDHRLVLLAPALSRPHALRLPAGVAAGAPQHSDWTVAAGAFDDAAQAAARAGVGAAESALDAARARAADAVAAAEAAEVRLRWLATLTGGGEGGLPAPADPDALVALLTVLDAQTRAATEAAREARRRATDAREAAAEAEDALARARDALARLHPLPEGTVPAWIVPVSVPAAAQGRVAFDDLAPGASWRPAYRLSLDTEARTLLVERSIDATLEGAEVWRDVALAFATTPARGRLDPATPGPDVVRLGPEVVALTRRGATLEAVAEADAPVDALAAPLPVATVEVRGLSVRLVAPEPATLRPGETARVALPPLDLVVALSNRAVPRRDATAFLMAEVTNGADAPLLPGPATLIRDGSLVGETRLDALARGATAEVGFGPLPGLPLSWRRVERGEGGAGVFRRSDTLREVIALSVENLRDVPAAVRLLHALPLSEQEDLAIDVSTEPAPDRRDWDGRRGVAAWDLDLAPGEARTVTVTVGMDWPEGERVDWRP